MSILSQYYCVNFASVLTTMSKKIKVQNLEDYEVGVYGVDISTPRISNPISISNILLIMMVVVIIMTTMMMRATGCNADDDDDDDDDGDAVDGFSVLAIVPLINTASAAPALPSTFPVND